MAIFPFITCSNLWIVWLGPMPLHTCTLLPYCNVKTFLHNYSLRVFLGNKYTHICEYIRKNDVRFGSFHKVIKKLKYNKMLYIVLRTTIVQVFRKPYLFSRARSFGPVVRYQSSFFVIIYYRVMYSSYEARVVREYRRNINNTTVSL